jgi:hypothetical protein
MDTTNSDDRAMLIVDGVPIWKVKHIAFSFTLT